jgi:hypothetical protein
MKVRGCFVEILDTKYTEMDRHFTSVYRDMACGIDYDYLDDAEQWLITTWGMQEGHLIDLFKTNPQLEVDAMLLLEKLIKN